MKIEWVTLKNFRAFDTEASVQLGALTTLVGRNDVGKSSVLHALDIFFSNRPLDPDDWNRGATSDARIEITIAFADVPPAIEFEEGVATTLAEEHLLNREGRLVIRRTWARGAKKPESRLLVNDFDHADFQNLCSKSERDLNAAGDKHGLGFSKAGRGVTNKNKRAQLREKAKDGAVALRDLEIQPDEDVLRRLALYFPTFNLFAADWRLSEEETPFQRVFRDMVDEATKTLAERQSIEESIEQFINGELGKIHDFLSQHTEDISSLSASPEFKWKDMVGFRIEARDRDGVAVPLVKRGAGLRRLLMVAYFRYLASRRAEGRLTANRVFGIEEPETYLHPGAQRELLKSLRAIAAENQVIVTSHSPVFAGATERGSLVWVTKPQGSAQVIQGDAVDLRALADDMGVEPSDQIYAYRACVFVEGRDDVEFLTYVACKLKEAGCVDATFADKQIGLVPVGGWGNMKLWVDRQAMRALSRRYGVFADSDLRGPSSTLSTDRLKVRHECEADGAVAHFTRKREIENYLHPTCVHRQTGKDIPNDDFCDVKHLIGDGCCGLVRHMSCDEILERDRYKDDQGREHHELLEVVQRLLSLT
ncbi:MAG: ATP-binding protein [Chloroflexi bacterium]|nr:ATP-binding protein [Chloroflexota bacterium]